MRDFLYFFFTDDCYHIAAPKRPTKAFKVHNCEDYKAKYSVKRALNRETNRHEDMTAVENVMQAHYRHIENIPSYHKFFNDKRNHTALKKFITDNFQQSKFSKPIGLAFFPDASIMIDKKCIEESILACRICKRLILIPESITFSSSTEPYLTLTRSSRAITLQIVRYTGIYAIKHFSHSFDDPEIMGQEIKALLNKFGFEKLPLYLYGADMEVFNELGTVVAFTEMMENAVKLFHADATKQLL